MRKRLLTAGAASALLYHFALPSGPAPWLGWVALVPLLLALERLEPKGPTATRWLALPFGLIFGLLQFRWMFSIVPAADVTVPGIMIPGALLWILYLTLYSWAFVRAMVALRARFGPIALWAAPPIWTLLEWIRGSGVFGFSWIHLSQTQATPGGYLLPAGWIGGLGLGFLMVFIQAAMVRSLSREIGPRHRGYYGIAAAMFVLAIGALPTHEAGEETLRAAALQGNVSLEDKWRPDYRDENLRIFSELSREAALGGARLVLWPETAYPVNLLYRRRSEEALRRVPREAGLWVMTGFQGLSPHGEGYAYRNSVGLFAPNGALEGVYSKMHLLPFGEYIPFAQWLIPGVEIDLGQANFSAGGGERVFRAADVPLAPFICYEMGFAGSTTRAVRRGARLLVNPTNDGWFEHPIALELHAALSPMRAAEAGVSVLRCGNSGITLWADPRGRVRGRLPVGERGLLMADLPISAKPSLYARTGAWLPLLLGLLYSLVWLVSALTKGGRAVSSSRKVLRRVS